MLLGWKVAVDPRDIVLDGDPAPPPLKGGRAPQFSADVYCGQTAAWIKMALGMEVGLCPGHIVVDGDPASPPQKRGTAPIFGPCLLWPNGWMDQGATWYDGRPRPGQHCVRSRPSSPLPKGTQLLPPPVFGPCLLWPISATTEHLFCIQKSLKASALVGCNTPVIYLH